MFFDLFSGARTNNEDGMPTRELATAERAKNMEIRDCPQSIWINSLFTHKRVIELININFIEPNWLSRFQLINYYTFFTPFLYKSSHE